MPPVRQAHAARRGGLIPAQDDVIQTKLAERGEWDPPWAGSFPPQSSAPPMPDVLGLGVDLDGSLAVVQLESAAPGLSSTRKGKGRVACIARSEGTDLVRILGRVGPAPHRSRSSDPLDSSSVV